MRLKEIETRLAEIKEELNTRAAELTDEEITKLETEVTDLQEERTALLTAAEKRKKLLERIAAGEPTGGAGADTTLLRNFKGAGGAGAGEPEDKYDTTAYRKAFMNYVCRGVAIPAEYRAAETTTTADSGAVIPTTIMNEIIQKLESYGSIYAKVRKINVQGGVSIPIADLKPTAHWITEAKSSDDQKASAKNSVTFNYYGLECKISQSILANVVTLKMFTDLFVPMATEAMVKAIEIAIFNGTGEGQPLGVLKDSRVTAVITLTPEEYASWNGWHKVRGTQLKIGNDIAYANYIEDKIVNEDYSPAAVLGELKAQGKEGDFSVTVCVTTLYSYIDKGIFLKLSNKNLPVKKNKKRNYKKVQRQQKRAAAGESIDKRPKEIDTREEFGNWEMDSVLGQRGKSKNTLLVLTERKTRNEIIFKLPDHTDEAVVAALDRLERKWGADMFKRVFKTITVDNGSEFADAEGLQRSIINEGEKRTKVYYCHPYSSWERGTNEVTNKMIRRKIPKGTNFDDRTEEEVESIENWINGYPRKIHGYHSAGELFEEEVKQLA